MNLDRNADLSPSAQRCRTAVGRSTASTSLLSATTFPLPKAVQAALCAQTLSSRFLGLTSPQPMSLGAVERKKRPAHTLGCPGDMVLARRADRSISQWLPNEIITQIIQASSASDQAALCRTSRLFHALGVPVLYRVVELLSKFLLYPSCEPFQISRTGMLI
jgi:hypothetical protein